MLRRHRYLLVGPAPPSLLPRPPASLPHTLDHASQKDRIIVLARDPYWLHAYWELSRTTLARAQAALGQEWHSAQPILRLMDVTSEDTTTATERQVRDIPIHGGVNNWYIDVLEPPRSFRIDIGYLSRRGKFYVLARSNIVSTPKAGVSDALEENWSDVQQQFDRVPESLDHRFATGQLVARPARPLRGAAPPPAVERLAAEPLRRRAAEPGPQVPLRDRRRVDRLWDDRAQRPRHPAGRAGPAPPRRHVHRPLQPARLAQIIPAVASSADGVEERTIVLAVERNTKELEPMIHDNNEL